MDSKTSCLIRSGFGNVFIFHFYLFISFLDLVCSVSVRIICMTRILDILSQEQRKCVEFVIAS